MLQKTRLVVVQCVTNPNHFNTFSSLFRLFFLLLILLLVPSSTLACPFFSSLIVIETHDRGRLMGCLCLFVFVMFLLVYNELDAGYFAISRFNGVTGWWSVEGMDTGYGQGLGQGENSHPPKRGWEREWWLVVSLSFPFFLVYYPKSTYIYIWWFLNYLCLPARPMLKINSSYRCTPKFNFISLKL